jgi:hypothetical protein
VQGEGFTYDSSEKRNEKTIDYDLKYCLPNPQAFINLSTIPPRKITRRPGCSQKSGHFVAIARTS